MTISPATQEFLRLVNAAIEAEAEATRFLRDHLSEMADDAARLSGPARRAIDHVLTQFEERPLRPLRVQLSEGTDDE